MISPHSWIHKINRSNSRIHKEDVIREAYEASLLGAQDAKIFLRCAQFAYDPFKVFNVKRVPITAFNFRMDGDYNEFFDMLYKLENKDLTGNAALNYIDLVSLRYNSNTWNDLLRPTLLKDLRIGATAKTFNKILNDTSYEIPVFECQLASDSEKHSKKLIGKKFIEPKLDGIRALAMVDTSSIKNEITIYSRNGKILENFTKIQNQISRIQFNALGGNWSKYQSFILDGEIVGESFQTLMKQVQRKDNVDASDSVFSIFDIIPLEQFYCGGWSNTQISRRNDFLLPLQNKIHSLSLPNLQVIESRMVDLDTADGHTQMHEYGTDKINLGYEGIVIKDYKAPYQCKRGTNWLKWKPVITIDLSIISVEEGTGRNKGRLGAIVCEGVDDGRNIRVNVGSGFSDKDRDDFWANKDKLPGRIVEIKADGVTQNQDGSYSLRFPRFERFRGFEAGEKL